MKEQEYVELVNVVRAAREVQTFLWGKLNEGWGLEEWMRMFRKRVVKLDAIDTQNPYALIELKKRVLQVGALAVGLLAILEEGGMVPTHKEGESVSNLSEYAEHTL